MKIIKKISWLWNRLKCMSIMEIGYRIYQKIHSYLQKKGIFIVHQPSYINDYFNITKPWIIIPHNINSNIYIRSADEILDGKLKFFSNEYNFDQVPNWNYDAIRNIKTPLDFGKSIDYRDSSKIGDIKYIWEPNRHLHLVTLAQAYALTKEEKYKDCLIQHLTSWLDQCPYLKGLNWTSSLELAIRLINWSIVWQIINQVDPLALDDKLKKRWLDSVYQHCHFINGHWSLYSSSNNHLIGEAAGLFISSITWPYWNENSTWHDKSKKILENEIINQTYDDGINKEQAFSYQSFVLEFFIFSGLAAKTINSDFSQEYWKQIEKMIEFIASIMDVNGNTPMIGDADDGIVNNLSQDPYFCPYQSLLATGAVLFNRSDFKNKSKKIDDKTKWLLGLEAENKFQLLPTYSTEHLKTSFPDGGYYIIGTDFGTNKEVKLITDVGELGYLSIAAHGHADALSFTLSVAGKEILIDPGTYAYHAKKKWRDYFRGTSAHNTLRIDGIDQSVSGGNFMWLKHARAVCTEWSENEKETTLIGKHNGYERLVDPTTHQRKIKLDKDKKLFFIEDTILCKKQHVIERFWHFSEHCDVTMNDNGKITVTNSNQKVIIMPKQQVKADIYFGNEDLPSGWISRKYDVKSPTTSVVWHNEIDGTCILDAIIECEF